MTVIAFEGAAGTGKTWNLMAALEAAVAAHPLLEGQKVLALTFMHGSRRRLQERLTSMAILGGRFECSTFDNLAWRLCHRWRRFARMRGRSFDPAGDFESTCDFAGWLLGHPEVRSWLRTGYPFVLVDEAQDLSLPRFSMVKAIAVDGGLFLAADEFQCLDTDLHDNPTIRWLRESVAVNGLTAVRRTDMAGLLDAARCLRQGKAVPLQGDGFKLAEATGVGLMAWEVTSALAWKARRRETVAIITPAKSGGVVDKVIEHVRTRQMGKVKKIGPFDIRWEATAESSFDKAMQGVILPERGCHQVMARALAAAADQPAVAQTLGWLGRLAALGAGNDLTGENVRRQVRGANAALSRLRSGRSSVKALAMTVQQAKNREFDGVIVLWPYQVPVLEEHRRRMLYNAITRAKKWCVVVVQADGKKERLLEPPFNIAPAMLTEFRAKARRGVGAKTAKGR